MSLLALCVAVAPMLSESDRGDGMVVRVAPEDCGNSGGNEPPDCYAALAAAVAKCRATEMACNVTLAPGQYRIGCPVGVPRPSAAQIEHPAVSLDHVHRVTFGGEPGRPRPRLLIDYVGGGCAAIVAVNASKVVATVAPGNC